MKSTGVLVVGFLVLVAIVGGVSWYLDRPSAPPERQARSEDPAMRTAAANRLAKVDTKKAVAELQRLVRDKDEWVATKAVRSLGQQKTDERRDLLAKLVRDSSITAAARGEAAATLGTFQDADPRVLTATLNGDPEAKARRGAAKGLVEMRKPETLPELVQALSDPDEKVRAYANAAIHNMIVRRFDIDPKQPPETQTEVVEKLKAYLKQCGAL